MVVSVLISEEHVCMYILSLAVYHCVFGDLEENLQKCIWRSLDDGCSNMQPSTATIVFWLDGFISINGEKLQHATDSVVPY